MRYEDAADECDPWKLRSLTIAELLALELPPREYLLSPVIPKRGLVMLFAQRGIGKTYTALSIAYAVAAGGSALKWRAPKPRRVLYIDGEMPLEALQERLADITSGAESEPPPENLRLLAADYQDWMPDLSTRDGQEALKPFLEGTELLVLDNLSTLVRCEGESESDSWIPIQEWLLKLRRRGIAVLLVHHAGKNGSQRGTSKREDILDTIISLKRPGDYEQEQGARFQVNLEKARGISGDDAKSFEASLEIVESTEGRKARWICTEMEDARLNAAVSLYKFRMNVRDVAQELGISKSTAHRLKDKAKAMGLLGE
jgi:putative DNA primase/helicase